MKTPAFSLARLHSESRKLMRFAAQSAAAASLALFMAPSTLSAQAIETVDPNSAMDAAAEAVEEVPGDVPIYGTAGADAATQAAGQAVNDTVSSARATARQAADQATQGIGSSAEGVVEDVAGSAVSDAAADVAADAASDAGLSVGNWDAGSFRSDDQAGMPADGSGYGAQASSQPNIPDPNRTTYGKDDLIGAASGVFGKGAEGLARMIEGWLSKQGEPNAYIVGREGGGALIFGARYGSGTLYHKVEGERPVYWTGPSIGLDAGANAGSTFILVYNLHDSQDLYSRFPQGEGQAYVVGGLTASYLRKGNIVLIPIRMGAGLRLGVNAGYLRFSEKQRWVPF